MKRQAFYSFNYREDAWRASQVRNMGLVEGNRPATDNEWQDVSRGGELAIKRWINQQMEYRTVLIVLIGTNTAGRKWINYEIQHAWEKKLGVCGIRINRLLDQSGQMSSMGQNPFSVFNLDGMPLSNIVPVLNPDGYTGQQVYASIRNRMSGLIEQAIRVRSQYS
jgi:hypothetical protein